MMLTGSNFYSRYHKISSFFQDSLQAPQIHQKVSSIGKRIFRYLARNQQAIAISLGSYVCLQAGVFAAELLETPAVSGLQNCQDMLCDHWRNHIGNHTSSSSILEFRCNTSHADYYPFSLVESCINDLCKYMKSVQQELEGCTYPVDENNILLDKEDLTLESKVWKALCPKLHVRHSNSKKKLKSINSCIQNLCSYFHVFSIKTPQILMKFCEAPNLEKVNNLVDRMTKAIHKVEHKLEEDDFWTRTNSISAAVGGVLGVVSSIFALGISILTYKGQIRNSDIRPTILVLKNMIPSIAQTNTALRIENVQNTVEEPERIEALESLLSEVQGFAHELSEIFEHTISYREEAEAVASEGIIDFGIRANGIGANGIGANGIGANGIGASGIGASGIGASGIGVVGSQIVSKMKPVITDAINTRIETIKRKGEQSLWRLAGAFINGNEIGDEVTEANSVASKKILKSIVVPGQALNIPKGIVWSEIIQDYVKDFINGPFTDPDLTAVQANRLNGTLQDWNGAFCTYNYPNILFCRYPTDGNTSPGTLLPTHYTSNIVRHNIPGLCYILLSELWCSWTKVFDLFFTVEPYPFTPNNSSCPWDLFSLRIEQRDSLEAIALGHCYNQSAILKV